MTYPELAPGSKIVVIACDVLSDEIRALGPSMNVVFMQQGLHNEPDKLRAMLQNAIDTAEREHEPAAIVLVYGLCSRGIEGVCTTHALLVAPRAHDCITLLLGSKERYADYVKQHPGTYWYSTGWNRCHLPPGPARHQHLRDRYAQRFDPDEVDFLMETEQQWFSTYDRATFVDLGLVESSNDEQYTQDCAKWLNWNYDKQQGDPKILRDLLFGPWDEERFAVAKPGEVFRMTADEQILRTELKVRGEVVS
jgi:Protein of unknown function (DUF1638)